MKITSYILFLTLVCIIITFSCTKDEPEKILPANNIIDLKNIFQVSGIKCREWNLPATSFKVSYPDNLREAHPKAGIYNSNYLELIKEDNGKFIESLSIGFFKQGAILNDTTAMDLLNNLILSFKNQYPELKQEFIGKKKLCGKEQYQFHITVPVKSANKDESGIYNFIVLLEPYLFKGKNGPEKNGVMFIFQSKKEAGSWEFKSFCDKGFGSKVLNTFRFTHE